MKRAIPLLVLLAVGGGVYWYTSRPVTSIVLTGIVTTNHIVVSPQITGRIDKLLVAEGDAVKADQLLAVLAPDELREERAFYSFSAEGVGSQVQESEAALRLQERQTTDQIAQAEANLEADASRRRPRRRPSSRTRKIAFERAQRMMKDGDRHAGTARRDAGQRTRSASRSSRRSRSRSMRRRRPSRWPSRSAEQVTIRRSQLQTNRKQQAAAAAQRAKADVRLAYTEIHAPIERHRRRSRGAALARSSRRGSRSSRSSIRTTCGCASTSRRPTSIACAWATS